MSRRGRPIEGVSSNGQHTLAVNSEHITMSIGACGLGYQAASPKQLAKDAALRCKQVSNPLLSPSTISCGWVHNLALSDSGSLYAWGCGSFTQSGPSDGCIPALGPLNNKRNDRETTVPTEVISPSLSAGVNDIAAGFAHSIALTKEINPSVVTFGANDRGQLGRDASSGEHDASGLPVDSVPRTAAVTNADTGRPASVGAGYNNTYVTSHTGVLLCAGDNMHGQCGSRAHTTFQASSMLERLFLKKERGIESAKASESGDSLEEDVVSKLQRVRELQGEYVVEADGGYCTTVARTRDGKVLTMGCGYFGERGDGTEGEDSSVSTVKLPEQHRALSISVGGNHCLAMTDKNEAWGWGDNSFGQLGVSSPDYIYTPIKVLDRVTAISAGDTHSACLQSDGRLQTAVRFSFKLNHIIPLCGNTISCADSDWENARRVTVRIIVHTQSHIAFLFTKSGGEISFIVAPCTRRAMGPAWHE